jgi:hypothetical protein
MLIGDTSRQHYSRERRQAGHKSYEGNNTGKQQQNMTLESSTNDFREKEEHQASHTGVELNNYVVSGFATDIDFLHYHGSFSGLHPPSGLAPDIDYLRYFVSLTDLNPPSGFATYAGC